MPKNNYDIIGFEGVVLASPSDIKSVLLPFNTSPHWQRWGCDNKISPLSIKFQADHLHRKRSML